MSDHHMYVGRAVGVPAHHLEKISRGAGGVDSVFGWLQAIEPEFTVIVGAKLAPKVVAGLVLGVEGIVLAVGAGLPHVEDSAWDATASLGVLDDTVEKCELPVFWHVLDHAAAKVPEGCFRGPERSENNGRCGSDAIVGDNCVVDLVNETGQKLLAMDGILFGENDYSAAKAGDCR